MTKVIKNKVFMAFATGKESTEGTSFKKYIGVAPIKVLGINPTANEIATIYGSVPGEEPVYISKNEAGVDRIRLDVYYEVDKEKAGVELKGKFSFFLEKAPRLVKEGTRVQVINIYGQTAYANVVEGKVDPTFAGTHDGWDSTEARVAMIGEEQLTNFLKNLLNIPNVTFRKKDGTYAFIADKTQAYAKLDNITKYFTGDISEIKNIIKHQPDNKIKALIGVKTTSEGKTYQDIYTKMFLKNNITSYDYLEKDVTANQAAGAYPNTEFRFVDIEEYIPTATSFKKVEENIPPITNEEAEGWFNA